MKLTINDFTFFLAILMVTAEPLTAQFFEIEGRVKIMSMDLQNNCDSIVVRTTDGTLAIRHVSTLESSEAVQNISRVNDTIFLTNGGFVTLPPDAINDSDSDPNNELQVLSSNGDTIFIENKNFIVIPGLRNLNVLNISIQERLDRGASPIEIYRMGFPLESIYGNLHKGGYIFFLDVNDELPGINGLVADTRDLGGTLPWGCITSDPIPEVIIGPMGQYADIGEGLTNTDAIVLDACSTASDAPNLCDTHIAGGHSDWFLPSILELEEMYLKIGPGASGTNSNIAGFNISSSYWSSTVSADNGTWRIDFTSGSTFGLSRSTAIRVRPVRAF